MLQDKYFDALAPEIVRKLGNLTIANIYMAGGGHIRNHIGQTDEQLKSRIKKERLSCASTFSSEAAAEKAIEEAFAAWEGHGAKQVAKWLLERPTERKFFLEGFAEETVGRLMKKNGTVTQESGYMIVLERRDDFDDRNRTTGMPFDIVTAYLTAE